MLLLLLQVGLASVHYSDPQVACRGERWNPAALVAAHRTIPCGVLVKITNRRSGESVRVRIVDRGPFVAGRVIDVAPAAARRIGLNGLEAVNLEQLAN